MISVIDYTEETKDYVRIFNYEWLQKYFTVEPIDELQLNNPKEEIIDKGGLIFYATYNGEIVGTATLLSRNNKVYELGKMAITEKFQGKGISNVLMQHCIDKAKELQADKLILYSNTKLKAAITLYKKFGFYEIPLANSHYVRSDIKMEKQL